MTAELFIVAQQPTPGGHQPPLQQVEWEVLPPEEKRKRQGLEPIFKWIAFIMDDIVRVPGTKFRFGLDPLLGLIPGIGDTSSALVSGIALIQAVRLGVPKVLVARMALNVLLNELIGIVPVVGDAFSFWFKSNARNYDIIKNHRLGANPRSRSDWIFVIGILVVVFLIVCAGIAISFLLLGALARYATGGR
ncbi:MAG TPA: DUF4112 domain-containing protein [Chthoniobacterales bacterium]|jgi:hypothetical protein|nr:DUF4112 domain-containing protein [Chthoniobacterales bacterium]